MAVLWWEKEQDIAFLLIQTMIKRQLFHDIQTSTIILQRKFAKN